MRNTRTKVAAARRSRSRLTKVQVDAARTRRPSPGGQVCIARVAAWDDRGPTVSIDGLSPVRARQCGGARAPIGSEVVVLVPAAGPPVVLGILRPLDDTLEARVDGRRVELDARDEIVLRCGEASITLRRNGRVVIRGVHVETRAAGVNRIKGGSVAIN